MLLPFLLVIQDVPAEIRKLTNLRNLNISFNPISSIPTQIGQCSYLHELGTYNICVSSYSHFLF